MIVKRKVRKVLVQERIEYYDTNSGGYVKPDHTMDDIKSGAIDPTSRTLSYRDWEVLMDDTQNFDFEESTELEMYGKRYVELKESQNEIYDRLKELFPEDHPIHDSEESWIDIQQQMADKFFEVYGREIHPEGEVGEDFRYEDEMEYVGGYIDQWHLKENVVDCPRCERRTPISWLEEFGCFHCS